MSESGQTTADQDREIRDQVCRTLTQLAPQAADHITITVERGVVHIWGILGEDRERAHVRDVASAIPRVVGVEDHRREWAWSD